MRLQLYRTLRQIFQLIVFQDRIAIHTDNASPILYEQLKWKPHLGLDLGIVRALM